MMADIRLTLLASLFLFVPSASGGQARLTSLPTITRSTDQTVAIESTTSALARRARLSVERIPLADGLEMLVRQSGVALAYSPAVIPTDRKVSCRCDAMTVGTALRIMLAGLPLEIAELEGGTLLIAARTTSTTTSPNETNATAGRSIESAASKMLIEIPMFAGTVTGRILSGTTNQPIASAQISIDRTTLGSITKDDGRYVITGIPDGEHTLRVRRIGFNAETRVIRVSGGEIVADFKLMPVSVALDEVIVTGTAGQARRREVGNSVGSINPEQLQASARTTVSELLQGQVTGLQQFANEGQVGSGSTISIRGLSSLTQSSEPLIYIDGIRVNNQTYMNNSLTRTSATGNPGAAGAQNSPKPMDNLNPSDILRIEVIRGPAATTLYGTEAAAGVIQIFTKRGQSGKAQWNVALNSGWRTQTPNTLGPVVGKDSTFLGLKKFLRTGAQRGMDLSVSGGTDLIKYFLSTDYEFAEGTLPKNDSRRVSLRGNFGFQPRSGLSIDVNSAFSNRTSSFLESGDNTYGFLTNVFRGTQDYTGGKPEILLDIDNKGSTDHFVGGVTLVHTVWPSVTTKLTTGVDYTNAFNSETLPFGFQLLPKGQRNTSNWTHRTLTADLATTWASKIAGASSALSVGGQFFQDYDHAQLGTAEGFGAPGDVTLSSGATTRASENALTIVNAGFFVQELLGIADRYFLTVGARADGNSSFGSDLGLQVYPKVSGSYVISDEKFWPKWWGVMKLRAAWGQAGKAPGAFDAVRTWNPVAGYEAQAGVSPATIGNPTLGPERTSEIETGFESSMFDDRISADVTWYKKTTDDALFRVTTPPSEGFLIASLRNVGKIESRGWEMSLTGVPISKQNVTWSITGRFSRNKSMVLDLGDIAPFTVGFASLGQWVRQGYPAVSVFGAKVTNPNEMADPIYAQDQYLGPVYPTFNYGFSTSLRLMRRVSVSVLGEGAGGHVALNNMPWQTARRNLWPECNQRQPLTEATAIWRARCSQPLPNREAWIRPADYFKLRTITTTFDLPQRFAPGANAASLSLQVQNPWKWQRHPGLDPELTRGGTFSVFPARYEYYQLSPARLISLSARVTF
jgi:TonB-dependent starch-binding outer membrane protein SusC